jgi:succinyl-diaminopimelate desuccinylase
MSDKLTTLSLTRKLLNFDTICPPGHEYECAHYLGGILESGGFEVSYYEFEKKRTGFIARIYGSDNRMPLCFTGHIDTVPLGAVPWNIDPFTGETEGDKLFGRGSSDMKSGVAAMVITALRLARERDNKAGITLVITAGEETGCEGAQYMAEQGSALGEAGAIIIGEPTSNYPLIGHKGVIWIEAITRGITAHGSMPDQGVNAISKAAEVIGKLDNYKFDIKPHPVLGPPTLNIGTISGGININSVPDKTCLGIDIRTIPGLGNEQIINELKSLLGNEVETKIIQEAEGISTDFENPWVQDVCGIMGKYINKKIVPKGITYFTDGSVLTSAYRKPPTLILGPGEPLMAHKTDEYCFISKMETITEAYTEIALKWCK